MSGFEGAWDPEVADPLVGVIAGADGYRRANRLPAEHEVLVVLPDWLYGQVKKSERRRLHREHYVVVRRHSDVYGSDSTGRVA